MILPTKRLSPNKSLIIIAGRISNILKYPHTLSSLWEEFKEKYSVKEEIYITYDWFILALDLLFMMDIIKFEANFISKIKHDI